MFPDNLFRIAFKKLKFKIKKSNIYGSVGLIFGIFVLHVPKYSVISQLLQMVLHDPREVSDKVP